MAGGAAEQEDSPPKAPGQDWKAKATAAWAQVRFAWGKAMVRLDEEKTGLLALLVAAVVCFAITALLYVPLGWPARLLNLLASRIPDGSCTVENTPGTLAYWFCNAGLALVSVVGSLLVVLGLWLARRHIKKGMAWVAAKLPKALRFLDKPVATTVLFAMAWSGIEFHFYRRPGLILDGLFPAIMGLVMFALVRWEDPIKQGLGPVWPLRDRLTKWARIGVLVAIPFLLALLLTPILHSPKRDQLVAIVGLLLGWMLFTKRPEHAPPPKARPTAATSLVVGLGLVGLFLLVVAIPVSAYNHCTVSDTFSANYVAACEASHHNAVMGTAGGVIAAGTTAVLVPTGKDEGVDEPEEDEEADEDVDPCQDQEDAFAAASMELDLARRAHEFIDQYIQRKQVEYDQISDQTMVTHVVGVAGMAVGLAGRLLGGAAATTFAGAAATGFGQALTAKVVEEVLQKAFQTGGKLDMTKAAEGLLDKAQNEYDKAVIQKTLFEALKDAGKQDIVAGGFAEGTELYEKAMAGWAKHAKDMAGMVGDVAGILGQAQSGWTMVGDYQYLNGLLEQIAFLRKRRHKLWASLFDLQDTFDEAKHQLGLCRILHPEPEGT